MQSIPFGNAEESAVELALAAPAYCWVCCGDSGGGIQEPNPEACASFAVPASSHFLPSHVRLRGTPLVPAALSSFLCTYSSWFAAPFFSPASLHVSVCASSADL